YKAVQPRVFTMKVSSGTNIAMAAALEQDLMQDWSRVNGGHYAYVANEGEMEVGFDRVAKLLRGPANYTLALETAFRGAPGLGAVVAVADGAREESVGGRAGAGMRGALGLGGLIWLLEQLRVCVNGGERTWMAGGLVAGCG